MSITEAMPGITFGCDPELFVINPEGEFVTAAGLIPGTKESPYKVEHGAVQVDGMAAEFNIDPVTNFEDFDRNVTSVMKTLKKMLPKGYSLACVPSVTFSEKAWEEAPDDAKILGCTPDFNAWEGTVNPPPDGEITPRFRTAAGHVHVGWTEGMDARDPDHYKYCTDLVKQLDWYLGAWSTKKDKDTERRRLYGKAGSMRFKPYGVEYRVLSNFWVRTPGARLAMWNRLQDGIWAMRDNFVPGSLTGFSFKSALIESINQGKLRPELTRNFSFLRG
jgi:hypothetical protein